MKKSSFCYYIVYCVVMFLFILSHRHACSVCFLSPIMLTLLLSLLLLFERSWDRRAFDATLTRLFPRLNTCKTFFTLLLTLSFTLSLAFLLNSCFSSSLPVSVPVSVRVVVGAGMFEGTPKHTMICVERRSVVSNNAVNGDSPNWHREDYTEGSKREIKKWSETENYTEPQSK